MPRQKMLPIGFIRGPEIATCAARVPDHGRVAHRSSLQAAGSTNADLGSARATPAFRETRSCQPQIIAAGRFRQIYSPPSCEGGAHRGRWHGLIGHDPATVGHHNLDSGSKRANALLGPSAQVRSDLDLLQESLPRRIENAFRGKAVRFDPAHRGLRSQRCKVASDRRSRAKWESRAPICCVPDARKRPP